MIKFALRRNLIYFLQYIIWSFARDILTLNLEKEYKLGKSCLYLQFMFFGELLAGIIMYFSQRKYNKKKKEENKEQYFLSIKLIRTDSGELVPKDSKKKIFFLIFFVSSLDLIEFLLFSIYLPKLYNISRSLTQRLFGFTTIFSLFFYVYALKLPVYKHHIFSLLIIGICLMAIIGCEFCFIKPDIFTSYKYLCIAIVYILFGQMLLSCIISIEKYLFEYDYMNPFVILIYEGAIGFFLSFLTLIQQIYFNDFSSAIKDLEAGKVVGFVFMLIGYSILSGGEYLFRLMTTKIFSPMVTTLAEYVLNPLYFIYFYFGLNDFIQKKDGKLDVAYFIINIIISLIISFFGCVYNEFIILFFCGLERNTHDQVSKRASSKIDENLTELMKFDESTEMSMNDETNSVIK
jgi:hypothetical protein